MDNRLLQLIKNNDYVSYENLWNKKIDNIRGVFNRIRV